MLADRRVIPFIGAGFSFALGMPGWDDLLARVAKGMDGALPYDTVREACQGDFLQIAEYYFLKSDRSIGPLRYILSLALQSNVSPVQSGCHVELVNLGAQQIYTTNFDGFIEQTFRDLEQPVDVVALPKDVAVSSGRRTSVVKYHGDLRHDSTLVLTESSYYTRLDFESPMDLKFRSDLLGRSVLFAGYSFRDVNIRVIWFKLMQMMKDIPASDRPTSYMVRFEPNSVLETLYDSVGLKTIVLDPNREFKTPEERSQLLARFMVELNVRVSPDAKIPGSGAPMFASTAFFDAVRESVEHQQKTRRWLPLSASTGILQQMSARRIPPVLAPKAQALLQEVGLVLPAGLGCDLAVECLKQNGTSPIATAVIAMGLCRQESRKRLLESDTVPWAKIWSGRVSHDQGKALLKILDSELEGHQQGNFDADLAYATDLASRISRGELVESAPSTLLEAANALLTKTGELYPAVSGHVPGAARPDVKAIVDEIQKAEQAFNESINDEMDPEDVPF
jgi:hypothetical protein